MEARGHLAHSTTKVEYSLTSLQRNAGKSLIPMTPSLLPFILCGEFGAHQEQLRSERERDDEIGEVL
jgi:hypothetical protein